MNGRLWLCIEKRPDGSILVHGDTGTAGFDDPYAPNLCQFGGWMNHGQYCGWHRIRSSVL